VVCGGVGVCCFLVAVGCWVTSTLRRVKQSKRGRNAFGSSALNNLKQGVVITNARQRIVFLNDRYLEIYGLSRSDITPTMTGKELLELRRERGVFDITSDGFWPRGG